MLSRKILAILMKQFFFNVFFISQMDYKNLSVCFTPAFFHIFGVKYDKLQSAKRRKRNFNTPKSEKDFEDTIVRFQNIASLSRFFYSFVYFFCMYLD